MLTSCLKENTSSVKIRTDYLSIMLLRTSSQTHLLFLNYNCKLEDAACFNSLSISSANKGTLSCNDETMACFHEEVASSAEQFKV